MGNSTDFNDLAQTVGTDAVRAVVEKALQGTGKAQQPDDSAAQNPAETWDSPVLFDGGMELSDISAQLAPGALGAYASAVADELQVPQAAPLLIGLAVAACAVQGRWIVKPEREATYNEPTSLFAVVFQPSGTKKSEIQGRMIAPLQTAEREADRKLRKAIDKLSDDAAVREKRIAKLRDLIANSEGEQAAPYIRELDQLRDQDPPKLARPRFFSGDTTPEQLENRLSEQRGRMAVFSDEGGAFATMCGMYTGGESRLDVFLQGHAGSPLRVDRASRQVIVDRPAVSLGLMAQAEILTEMQDKARQRLRYTGLLARVMWAMPPNMLGRRDVRRRSIAGSHVVRGWHERIYSLLETPEEIIEQAVSGEDVTPQVLVLSDDSRELWIQYQERVESEMGDGGQHESMRDWVGKSHGLAMRIAAVFHLIEHGPNCADTIQAPTMESAITLVEQHLMQHARAILDQVGADPASADAQRITSLICRREIHGPASKSELARLTKGAVTGTRLDRAIQILQDRAILGAAYSEQTNGRPKTLFPINPRLFTPSRRNH